MKLILSVAVLVSVLAAVSADIFGANDALNNKFPGSKPISVNDYNKLVQQQQARPTTTPSPRPNWMFETTSSGTIPTAGPRQARVKVGSDEDLSDEDLSDEDLSDEDLSDEDLSHEDLSGEDLSGEDD